jgi:hypothetical protein
LTPIISTGVEYRGEFIQRAIEIEQKSAHTNAVEKYHQYHSNKEIQKNIIGIIVVSICFLPIFALWYGGTWLLHKMNGEEFPSRTEAPDWSSPFWD